MKLIDIIKKVGSAVIRDVVPGGGLVIDAVNAILPDSSKLPKDATGSDLDMAVRSLPEADQTKLYMKEYDVQVVETQEWTKVLSALAEADKAGASTRPKISLMMGWTVVFAVGVAVSAWAVAMFTNDAKALTELRTSWPLILTVIGTPTYLLKTYFGARMEEKKARYSTVSGANPAIPSGIIGNLINAFKGK